MKRLSVKRRCEMARSLIPWRETLPAFSRFEEEMENMMEEFFGRREPLGRMWGGEKFVPTANVTETENELEVTIDLPGLKPEEVNLELREGALWITGERKEEKEEKEKTFHRMERRYGAFRRIIPLPFAVNEEKIEAEFRHGVLAVKLPKTEEAKPKHIEVKALEEGLGTKGPETK
jgi:HSP20 family protein